MFKKIINPSNLLVIIISTFLVVLIVYAFTEPTQAPPDGNVPAPLNVGPAGQSKAGGLILNTGGATSGLIVDKGNVGIGTREPQAKLDVIGNVSFGEYANLGEDSYGQWKPAQEGATDTCHGNSRAEFTCGVNDVKSCEDIRISGTEQIVRELREVRCERGIAGLQISSGKIVMDGVNVGIGRKIPARTLDVAGYVGGEGFCIGYNCISSWRDIVSEAVSEVVSKCKICLEWRAQGDYTQCSNSVSSMTCASIDSWTAWYIDDTDERMGGCQMRWKIDCTEPYGD